MTTISEEDEWIPFDYDNKDANPLPPSYLLVWVHDEFYDGVTVGQWVNGWWETIGNKDDCSVTHWRPLVPPAPPQ